MLGWLRTMQLDPIGDDNSIRALLKLPPYKAHPAVASKYMCLFVFCLLTVGWFVCSFSEIRN